MPQLEATAKAADEELATALAAIPHLPLAEVPEGVDEHGNVQRHVSSSVNLVGQLLVSPFPAITNRARTLKTGTLLSVSEDTAFPVRADTIP